MPDIRAGCSRALSGISYPRSASDPGLPGDDRISPWILRHRIDRENHQAKERKCVSYSHGRLFNSESRGVAPRGSLRAKVCGGDALPTGSLVRSRSPEPDVKRPRRHGQISKGRFSGSGENVSAFPPLRGSGISTRIGSSFSGVHSPVTAARPRRFFTAFPLGGLRPSPRSGVGPSTPLPLGAYPTRCKGSSKERFSGKDLPVFVDTTSGSEIASPDYTGPS